MYIYIYIGGIEVDILASYVLIAYTHHSMTQT